MREMGGVGGVCMCLAWGRVMDEWVRIGLGIGLYQLCRNRVVWDMCLCMGCGGVGGWLGPESERVGW